MHTTQIEDWTVCVCVWARASRARYTCFCFRFFFLFGLRRCQGRPARGRLHPYMDISHYHRQWICPMWLVDYPYKLYIHLTSTFWFGHSCATQASYIIQYMAMANRLWPHRRNDGNGNDIFRSGHNVEWNVSSIDGFICQMQLSEIVQWCAKIGFLLFHWCRDAVEFFILLFSKDCVEMGKNDVFCNTRGLPKCSYLFIYVS